MSEPILLERPVKVSTFEEIKSILEPIASRGWIKRFESVKDKRDKWVMVIKDFDIFSPKIEIVIEDILRCLEPRSAQPSIVRKEMEQLEADGKLNIDTPEEEAKWEAKLEEERKRHAKFYEEDEEARLKQRQMDLQFIKSKQQNIQGVKSNVSLPTSDVKIEHKTEDEMIEKRRIEAEKAQEEERKKDTEQVLQPKMAGVAIEGEEVYSKDEPVTKLKSLTPDALRALKSKGVVTVSALKKMKEEEAIDTLGEPLYRRLQKENIF
jgi:hypothetical protein